MQESIAIFWFRRDLRLDDNTGLIAALNSGLPVLPIFIFDEGILNDLSNKQDPRVSFIYQAIQDLHEELKQFHSTIDVRYGKPLRVFRQLMQDYNIKAVYTNHDYEPYARKRDEAIQVLLAAEGVAFYTYRDQVIFEKDDVMKDDGTPYQVYTPYARKWRSLLKDGHLHFQNIKSYASNFFRTAPLHLPVLSEFGFEWNPNIPGSPKNRDAIINKYDQTRNLPAIIGTTHFGIHLRFGTISIRKLIQKAVRLNDTFLRELIWREFFMQLLWHHPEFEKQACKREYDKIQWRNNEDEFRKWCRGETGYPIVDAGMRELNETGFMHNRVRMITASFLVKDLLVDWRWGEAYFAEKLLDYELASNNGNWQWVAGCGCDAAPYFRIFSPLEQAKKFDPDQKYIRKWIPEIDSLSYPLPMVDHSMARQRCLKTYQEALGKKPV